MKTILLTGGSGRLGRELLSLDVNKHKIIAPTKNEFNIRNLANVRNFFDMNNVDIILHCAANTDLHAAEINSENVILDNVIGTSNVLMVAMQKNVRFVLISSSHVFDGKRGMYHPHEPINPCGNYAKSKAASELVVRTYSNSLVIRVEFFGREFPYNVAFCDKYATKLYSDEIAPIILNESISEKVGVLHLDIERCSIYDIAKRRKPHVKKSNLSNYTSKLPNLIDTSLAGGIYDDRNR